MNDESVWRFLLLSHIYLSICTSSTESVNELVSKCTWLEFCFPIGGKGTCNFKWFTSRLKLCGKFLSMLANQFFRIWAELVFFYLTQQFLRMFHLRHRIREYCLVIWVSWYLFKFSQDVQKCEMDVRTFLWVGGDEEYHNLL